MTPEKPPAPNPLDRIASDADEADGVKWAARELVASLIRAEKDRKRLDALEAAIRTGIQRLGFDPDELLKRVQA
jgi:hypothetical protein